MNIKRQHCPRKVITTIFPGPWGSNTNLKKCKFDPNPYLHSLALALQRHRQLSHSIYSHHRYACVCDNEDIQNGNPPAPGPNQFHLGRRLIIKRSGYRNAPNMHQNTPERIAYHLCSLRTGSLDEGILNSGIRYIQSEQT